MYSVKILFYLKSHFQNTFIIKKEYLKKTRSRYFLKECLQYQHRMDNKARHDHLINQSQSLYNTIEN